MINFTSFYESYHSCLSINAGITPAGVGLGLASGKDAECAVALIIMIIAAFAAVSSII